MLYLLHRGYGDQKYLNKLYIQIVKRAHLKEHLLEADLYMLSHVTPTLPCPCQMGELRF